MKIMYRTLLAVFALLSLVSAANAQLGRDPLTSQEVDALRESRQEPDTRLKLFVKYARERMDGIQHVHDDPRLAESRPARIHDLLQDLGKIVEEMDDNVDLFASDKFDIRKSLKEVVAADTEFVQKLTAIKKSAEANPDRFEEMRKNYQFVFDDTMEIVKEALASASKTLAEQEAIAKDKNKKNELRKPD